MKTNTICLLLAGLLFFFQSIQAQHLSIKGKVTDESGFSALEFAGVSLLSPDSVFIQKVNTNEDGTFTFTGIKEGNYLLSCAYLGYKSTCIPLVAGGDPNEIQLQLVPAEQMLNEITVEASPVVQTPDRKLLIPSQTEVKTATDGVDLLRKMQPPRIIIDPVNQEISLTDNGELQIRLNGVQVTNADIQALAPGDIQRIEYYDNPGARYGNASAVLNYITRRQESGGSVRGSFQHNLGGNKTSAHDQLAFKFNHKKSEFSAQAGYIHRKQDWTREYSESLVFPDYTLYRTEKGSPTPFDKKIFNSTLNYSLVEKDNYMLNVQLNYTLLDFPAGGADRRSTVVTEGSEDIVSIYDHTKEKSHSPALDLYFQKNLTPKDLLILNVVGTYIDSDNNRLYQQSEENKPTTEIQSVIRGDKYSLIAEGIYEKTNRYGKFTAGLKQMQAYTQNQYSGSSEADVSLVQSESNVYVEYRFRYGKWEYMGNVTGTRFYYSQDAKKNEKYALQPAARIMFEPFDRVYFRYHVKLLTTIPSLAFMNDAEQIIEPIQVRRGNPELNSFRTLNQQFSTGYTQKMFSVDLLLNYDRQYKPVMESVLYENGIFVHTYFNQKAFHNLGGEVSFRIKPWQDYISLSVAPRVNRYISEGNDYLHTYTMTEIRVNLDVSWKNLTGSFTTTTPPRSFYGEQLVTGNQMYVIMAGYKTHYWSLMLGALSPFTEKYKGKNENYSALNPVRSELHTRNMTQKFIAQATVNLDFGKQSKSSRKRLNNTDRDPGIMQGTKN